MPTIVIADNTTAMANKYFRSISAYDPATSTETEITFIIRMPSCSDTTKGALTKSSRIEISNAKCRQRYSAVAIAMAIPYPFGRGVQLRQAHGPDSPYSEYILMN